MTRTFSFHITLIAVFAAFLFVPLATKAATCNFTVNLELGYQGEEVRCLQQYLNANGYKVSDSGVGSPGQETSLYREKTIEAVRRWQVVNGVMPATGTFGPLSRAKYLSLTSGGAPATPATPATPSSPAVPATPSSSSAQAKARTAIKAAMTAIKDVENKVEQADDAGWDVDEAEDFLRDAEGDLYSALFSFLDEDYNDALINGQSARDFARDALEALTSGNDPDRAESALENAEEAIENAWDDVRDAENDDEDVGDAEELLEEAEELLEEAEEAFDDEDYDDAIELAQEVEERVEEALDSID